LLYKAHGVDSTRFEAFRGESNMRGAIAVPHQNTVFRQLTNGLPWGVLDRLTAETGADERVRKLDTKTLLLTLLFAQVSEASSLRDIEAIVASQAARCYHSRSVATNRLRARSRPEAILPTTLLWA
jgi:hypothetical protein